MVFTVRCFKCGDSAVRLVLGGRAILHARCHACGSNLLAEVFEFEQQVLRERAGGGAATSQTMEVAVAHDVDPPTGEFPAELFEDELAEMA